MVLRSLAPLPLPAHEKHIHTHPLRHQYKKWPLTAHTPPPHITTPVTHLSHRPLHHLSRRPLLARSRFAVLPIGEDNGIVEWVPHTAGLRHCLNDTYAAAGLYEGSNTNRRVQRIWDAAPVSRRGRGGGGWGGCGGKERAC